MIKIVAFIRRNPALSSEQCRDYWKNVHVLLIKERLPDLIKYIGSFPVPSPDIVVPNVQEDVDAIVELGFRDRATMKANMNSPGFLAEDRVESRARLVDLERTRAIVVEEVVIPVASGE